MKNKKIISMSQFFSAILFLAVGFIFTMASNVKETFADTSDTSGIAEILPTEDMTIDGTDPLVAANASASSVKAFPTAQGYGAVSVGGRKGKVIEVTNLNDSGPGSFRDAVTAPFPRTVVFRVAGTIELLTRIEITTPYLTIAGQTAPGSGITLKKNPLFDKGIFRVRTHDVVIRYLRIRTGGSPNDGGTIDSILIDGGYNIIVDHSSFSWGTDEILQTASVHDVSIQWNILAEGLANATHPKGEHSKGFMFWQDSKNISAHHNLIAHNHGRNPDIDANGRVDLVNNIFYDGGAVPPSVWGEVKNKYGAPTVNIVNNYYKEGPSSPTGAYEVVFYHDNTWPVPAGGFQDPKIFVKGNIGYHRSSDTLAQNLIVRPDSRFMITATRFPAPAVTTFSATDAFTKVLANAGANKPVRDAHDARVVNDTKNKTGKVIDNPSQVGGWLTMTKGTAPVDSDHDGMPNAWETSHKLNPNSDKDGALVASNGYTNLENYLNSIAGTI